MRATLGTQLVRSMAHFLPNCHVRHRLDASRPALALTFEDGPHPDSTPELLDLLAEHQLKATFFLIGEKAASHPHLVSEIARQGHTLGNHTYHHKDIWRISTRQAIREIHACSRVIDGVTGKMPVWWRPPYGHVTNRLADWCQRHGLQTALWDVLGPDFSRFSGRRSLEKTLERKIRPGSIISLHDSPVSIEKTAAALRNSLPRLLDQGWQFDRLESSAAA